LYSGILALVDVYGLVGLGAGYLQPRVVMHILHHPFLALHITVKDLVGSTITSFMGFIFKKESWGNGKTSRLHTGH
jgi:hypothetical protein